jgi:hypothetical protein
MLRTGEFYRITGVVEAMPRQWEGVAAAVHRSLSEEQRRSSVPSGQLSGPFVALGRQDLVFIMRVTDLERFAFCTDASRRHGRPGSRLSHTHSVSSGTARNPVSRSRATTRALASCW